MATSNVQINTPTQVTQRAADSYQDGPFTYSSSTLALAVSTTATDFFTITNPAGSLFVVRVVAIGMSGTALITTGLDIGLVKRTSQDSGGTFTTSVAIPHDSTNPAAVAVTRAYTANPTTLGTSAGTKRAVKFPLLAAGTALSAPTYLLFDADGKTMQPYVLRPNESICLNIGGASASTTLSIDGFFEWTESLY